MFIKTPVKYVHKIKLNYIKLANSPQLLFNFQISVSQQQQPQCGADNSVDLWSLVQGVPPNVLNQLQKVYTSCIDVIKQEIPLHLIYGKCGGKCINLIIKSLAIVLDTANKAIKKCRGSADSNCVARCYGEANRNAQIAIAATADCLNKVGIPIDSRQHSRISSRASLACVNAIEDEAASTWTLFPFS